MFDLITTLNCLCLPFVSVFSVRGMFKSKHGWILNQFSRFTFFVFELPEFWSPVYKGFILFVAANVFAEELELIFDNRMKFSSDKRRNGFFI